MSAILELLKQLLTSKKFVGMVVGGIGILLARLKLNVDPQTVAALVALVISFILGQGIADNGKEAAKINAVSAGAASSVPGSTAAVGQMADQVKKTT